MPIFILKVGDGGSMMTKSGTRLAILIAAITIATGCHNPQPLAGGPQTVGIRVFHRYARETDSTMWIRIETQDQNRTVVQTRLTENSTHNAYLFDCFAPNTPINIIVRYEWVSAEGEYESYFDEYVFPLTLDDNYDIYIEWEPAREFNPESNPYYIDLYRRPMIRAEKGRPQLF